MKLGRTDNEILYVSNAGSGTFATVAEFREFIDDVKAGYFDGLAVE